MTYNGHKNRVTWMTSLFLDGNYTDESTYHEVVEIVRSESSVFKLAEALREFVADNAPDGGSLFVCDLIRAALDEVDWAALASGWKAELTDDDDNE